MKAQLVLPLDHREAFAREDFAVGPTNCAAIAFLESWPGWHVPAVAIHGPEGSGKSHLVSIWQRLSGATRVCVSEPGLGAPCDGPLAVEDVDSATSDGAWALGLFHVLERATAAAPVLLTGREAPSRWRSALPDLVSRFAALPDFAIWAPDDELLSAIARKLFADRQLTVPDGAIGRMLRSLERSPAAIREFVAQADRKALAESRPVTTALIGELLVARDKRLA